MGANTQDMINQLQQALAMGNQPSFAGVQAPPSPQALTSLLATLKQQQQMKDAAAPTPGPYGYLHDAGKAAFNDVGQQIGQGIGGALNLAGQPPPGAQPAAAPPGAPAAGAAPGAPAAPLTSQAAINAAIQQAKSAYAAQVGNGVDPDTAKVNTLKALVAAGVPGADDALDKANEALLKNASTKAGTAKDTAQANMDTASIGNQAREAKQNTWTTTKVDPNGLFELQTNGLGEVKRVELNPPPNAGAQAAGALTDQSLDFAAQWFRQHNGSWPASFSRSPAMQAKALNYMAAQADATGDTVGAITARGAALKANGQAVDQQTKLESNTTSYYQTLDKNLTALQALKDKVDSTGSPLLNKAVRAWQQGGTGDADTAAYVTMLNAVQGEYAKIKSGSLGNTPASDSAMADAKDVINKNMNAGSIDAVAQAMRQEGGNRLTAIHQTKQALLDSIQGSTAVPVPGKPGAPGAAPPKTVDFSSLK